MNTAFAVVAAVTVVASVAPQVVRVVRARDVSGVSSTAATFAAVSCGAWTAYGLVVGHHVAAASSGLGVAMWGTVAGVAARRNGEAPSVWTLPWGVSLLAAGLVDVGVLGVVLVIEALTYTLPQALRVRRRTDGVSPTTWLLTFVSACSWVLYGAGTRDPVLAVANVMKAAVSGSIVAELYRNSSARPRCRDAKRPTPPLARWNRTGVGSRPNRGTTSSRRSMDPASITAHSRPSAGHVDP